MTEQNASIASPCILVCSIDDKTGYCFGCGRTSREITDWIAYTPDERKSVMDQLEQRLSTVERKPRRETRRRRMARLNKSAENSTGLSNE